MRGDKYELTTEGRKAVEDRNRAPDPLATLHQILGEVELFKFYNNQTVDQRNALALARVLREVLWVAESQRGEMPKAAEQLDAAIDRGIKSNIR